jgi:hypothetical protein
VKATEARGEDPVRRLRGAVRDLGILEGGNGSFLTVTCYGWYLGQGGPRDVREGGRIIPEDASATEGVDFHGRFVTKRVRGRGDPADGIRTSSEALM